MFTLDWLGRLRQRMNGTAARTRGKAQRPDGFAVYVTSRKLRHDGWAAFGDC